MRSKDGSFLGKLEEESFLEELEEESFLEKLEEGYSYPSNN